MQICAIQSFTQELEPDSDENLVSFYLLSAPLTCLDGSKVIKLLNISWMNGKNM